MSLHPPLNGPLEFGIRALTLLAGVFPDGRDVESMARLDHVILHSSVDGGPSDLHPNVPGYEGEVGIKRGLIEDGLEIMLRAGLVGVRMTERGIEYHAQERGVAFVSLLEAPYVAALIERTQWALGPFSGNRPPQPRSEEV